MEHERLRIIRQAWYHIATSRIYNIEEVKAAISDEPLRQNIMMDSGIPLDIVNRIKHPIYWSYCVNIFGSINTSHHKYNMQFPLKIPLRGIDVILMGTKLLILSYDINQ